VGWKLEEAWNFFKRKALMLSEVPVPSKRKELLRASSRSNLMDSHLKKEVIIKQKVSTKGMGSMVSHQGNPRLLCTAMKHCQKRSPTQPCGAHGRKEEEVLRCVNKKWIQKEENKACCCEGE